MEPTAGSQDDAPAPEDQESSQVTPSAEDMPSVAVPESVEATRSAGEVASSKSTGSNEVASSAEVANGADIPDEKPTEASESNASPSENAASDTQQPTRPARKSPPRGSPPPPPTTPAVAAPPPASPPPASPTPASPPPASPPPPPPPPAPSQASAQQGGRLGGRKQPRHWWNGSVRSPRGSRSHSRSHSREGSPLAADHPPTKPRSPAKSIADLVLNALVNAASGKALSQHAGAAERVPDTTTTTTTPTTPAAARPKSASPAPAEAEEVPNITFTFFDAKENNHHQANGDVEEADEAIPDEEWEDEPQREREVTETVIASPQRVSVAMTSDGDDEFVDARGTSSDSDSPGPGRAYRPASEQAGAPPEARPPSESRQTPGHDEEPEYVCVERRSPGSREETPSATVNPIYRSPSYSHAVEEGLYSCPRPQGAPPPPPPGSPPAPPTSAPPPVPEPDWTSTDSGSNQMTSEYATFYVLPTGEPTSLDGAGQPAGGAASRDYEELEYCSLRASQRARRPKSMAAGCPGAEPGAAPGAGAAARPRVQRVRSRLGRAWRSVRGWWEEERARLGDTFMRHVHAQAVGAFDRPPSSAARTPATAHSCDTLDGDADDDDFDDDDDDANEHVDKEAAREEQQQQPGMFKRAISAPTIPRVLVLRRRKDSDGASSASTSVSNWGRATLGRPGSRRSKYMPEGQNGFEELRRYVKQGGDFCKDLTSILQERSEAEQVYAKSLAKLSAKLLKASKDAVGTVGQAWQRVGTEMECQGEIHRTFAVALSEEVVKPLKQLVDSQHRIRKSVESSVDKTAKSLLEWRQAEAKSKKSSFMCARDNEKLQDAMVEGRQSTRGSSLHLHHTVHNKMSDKDVAKLETKRRKAEDSVKKADVEYYTFCIRAERARLEWETAVIRGSYCMQALEEERLQNLKELASMYLRHVKDMGPKMVQSSDRLNEPVQNCDVAADIQTVVSLKGTGQPPSEQLLPDFYAEHVTLGMNRDRRKQALVKVLQLIKQDLERERRSKQGVENLARALQQTPNFGAEDSQQNVTEKLHHMRAMLTYLEAARYKVQSVLSELEGRPNQTHPLSSHIIVHRDRQGLQQSILKVPPWVRKDSLDQMNGESPDWMDRGAADGNSVQPDSDFDEFSSQGSEKDFNGSLIISECASTTQAGNNQSVGTCRALYQYAANLYDELNLNPGDVINIHDKQDDGWWLGELNGTVGIFPATYVEEIK